MCIRTARLSAGDNISLEAKYLAFAELTVYMGKKQLTNAENTTCEKIAVFKLAELASLYQERLLSVGLNVYCQWD